MATTSSRLDRWDPLLEPVGHAGAVLHHEEQGEQQEDDAAEDLPRQPGLARGLLGDPARRLADGLPDLGLVLVDLLLRPVQRVALGPLLGVVHRPVDLTAEVVELGGHAGADPHQGGQDDAEGAHEDGDGGQRAGHPCRRRRAARGSSTDARKSASTTGTTTT